MKRFYFALVLLLVGYTGKAQNFFIEKYNAKYLAAIGVGPSFIYSDNGGRYRSLDFHIRPAIDFSVSKSINNHLLLRANYGNQWVRGKNQTYYSGTNLNIYYFRGTAYTFDLTLTGFLKPYKNILYRPQISAYANTGIGWVIMRNFNVDRSGETEPELFYSNAPYLPIRIGLLYKLDSKSDIGIEGTTIVSFSDRLDGIVTSRKNNDHFAQFKITYLKYFTAQ